MATNVTERNKTLQEIIAWCETSMRNINVDYTETAADVLVFLGERQALGDVADHCRSMLGYSGSMPSEVPNHSEDANMTMNKDQGRAVWRESIEKYGKETQSIVCMEECSELIQAVSKCLRGKPGATDNLAEEMADVTICLYLLQEMYDITDEQLEEWAARKTSRQSKRMQADDPFMEGEDAK